MTTSMRPDRPLWTARVPATLMQRGPPTVRRAPTVARLKTTTPTPVLSAHPAGRDRNVRAPEPHQLNGRCHSTHLLRVDPVTPAVARADATFRLVA